MLNITYSLAKDGTRYRVSVSDATMSSIMTMRRGSVELVASKITHSPPTPSMSKKGKAYVHGYMTVAGDVVLDIIDISLSHGMVFFKARGDVTTSHPPGDLIGIVITDVAFNVVFEDKEMITPCPPGVNPGDTLELDFELDPKGKGKMERWVQAK